VVPTTSQPPRRSRGKAGLQHGNPLKSIALTVTLSDARREDLERLAGENGLTLEKSGGGTSLSFTATGADEALERLRLLADILASKA
jgi:hypothetical protein